MTGPPGCRARRRTAAGPGTAGSSGGGCGRPAGELDWPADGQRADRAGLRSVAAAGATRAPADGTVERFRRYFLSGLPPDAAELGRLVRNHRGIEGGQHWCPDVGSREDRSRARAGHGDRNSAAVRRIAPNLLERDRSVKVGIADKRLKAARNTDYLLAVVTGTSNPK